MISSVMQLCYIWQQVNSSRSIAALEHKSSQVPEKPMVLVRVVVATDKIKIIKIVHCQP